MDRSKTVESNKIGKTPPEIHLDCKILSGVSISTPNEILIDYT